MTATHIETHLAEYEPHPGPPPPLPVIRRVLVPTDLTDAGNEAVRYAYATAGPGGTVHLLHVVKAPTLPNPLYSHYTPMREEAPTARAAQRIGLLARLSALIPDDAASRGIATSMDVLVSTTEEDVVEAIDHAAERIGADLICLASRGRSGPSAAMAGSVAKRLINDSARPVLVVHCRDDG